jgi:hypothetical protein
MITSLIKEITKMRTELILADSHYQAKKLAPWAAKIAKVEGGFLAFESTRDYDDWRRNK